ncbi:hypothetical protein ACFVHB_40090 [Kitasatospora sp. NPDC127111]|uniref:hypothetical protein n=1 Tax=Kitasatospora sp. NPDC127111 TaxID=3345363 RepID=UPI0036423F6D
MTTDSLASALGVDSEEAEALLKTASSGYVFGNPHIWYAAHVQGIGWMTPVRDNATAGTEGEGRRLEALLLMGTGGQDPQGNPKPLQQITAQAYVQNYGWMDPVIATDGDFIMVGTVGESLRMEALRLSIVSAVYCVNAHVQNIGWQGQRCSVNGGTVEVGTTGKALRMEAIQIFVF